MELSKEGSEDILEAIEGKLLKDGIFQSVKERIVGFVSDGANGNLLILFLLFLYLQ